MKGKIHWILDDFAYLGTFAPKTGDTTHIVAKIENVIINEYMIKFYVCPHKDSKGDEWSYNVNLQVNCLSPLDDWTEIVNQFSHSKFRNYGKTKKTIQPGGEVQYSSGG